MMMRNLHPTILAVGGALFGCRAAMAQCRPPASSHEARLLAFYEVPAIFTMARAPERPSAGAIGIGAEIIPVPSPDPLLTHPQYCYQDATNNTKLAPLFGRPRLTVGLPAGLSLEGSYLPPLSAGSARVTIASLALSRVQAVPATHSRLLMVYRAHGTIGRVRGPITCPRGSLQTGDVDAPCFGTAPSHDRFDPNSFGGEAAFSGAVARLEVYAGGGVTWVRPHFQAGFTDGSGFEDRTTVDAALVRGSAFSGATVRLRDDVSISAQVYVVPADVTTLRVSFQYRLR